MESYDIIKYFKKKQESFRLLIVRGVIIIPW